MEKAVKNVCSENFSNIQIIYFAFWQCPLKLNNIIIIIIIIIINYVKGKPGEKRLN